MTINSGLRSAIIALGLTTFSGWADQARFTDIPPVIDGIADEAIWQQGDWYPIDQHILGELPAPEDFSGRYTLRWDKDHLYLLAEIHDDVLFDGHPDPTQAYWDDDCLEVFIDEDHSGGDHQHNHNAFAYHIALDNQAVDLGDPSVETPVVILNEHLESRWQRSSRAPYPVIWEVALKVFADDFSTKKPTQPVTLQTGKTMGFMLAYCDADGPGGRQHFLGSHPIAAVKGDKNLGYKNASVFDTLTLIPSASLTSRKANGAASQNPKGN